MSTTTTTTTTTTTPNIELLTEIKEWVVFEAKRKKANKSRRLRLRPEGPRWNQRDWIQQTECGTAFCVAGYAATRNGEEPVLRGLTNGYVVRLPDGVHVSVRDHAIDVLGITVDQSYNLFWHTNSAEEIVRLIDQIIEGAR